ncbi:hypothetical protein [Dyadobacter koreensis]|nr:hypothetical protein [Dyadobacter koreensis]
MSVYRCQKTVVFGRLAIENGVSGNQGYEVTIFFPTNTIIAFTTV